MVVFVEKHIQTSECMELIDNWWRAIRRTTIGTKFDFASCNSLMTILCLDIDHQCRCPGFFILVAEIISTNWLERNSVVFRNDRATIPTIVIWRKTAAQLEGLQLWTDSARIRDTIQDDIRLVDSFISVE